jgi:hypothetical protein
MSTEVVKFAFIAGELSPTLWGRGDLTKYDLGMAEAYNFFVDYRGGLSSRPGFQFCEFIRDDDKDTRLVEFAFSPDDEDTYVVLFGDEYIRFIQDGAYVLEDAKVITGITAANPAVVTSNAHGYTSGDWIKLADIEGMTELNGRTASVTVLNANTFSLKDPLTGANIDATAYDAWTAGGTASRVYEIDSPYTAEQLEGLVFDQYRDYIRVTSRDDLPPHDLIRSDHTDWEIVETTISPYSEGPAINAESMSAAGSAQAIFAVTSVHEDGSESTFGNLYKLDNMVNYPVTEGSVSVSWPRDPTAVEYKVYRSVVSVSEVLSYGTELGYVGRTKGTKFTDPNIIPDFGQAPPQAYNPFAPGAILRVTVTAGGAGYTEASVVTVDGGGTGFDAQVITDTAGAIVAIIVKSGGEGYTAPTVTGVTVGAGATFTVEARPMSGTYPALSAIFQQRQIYAASENQPITIWGSQTKRFDNFYSSPYVIDSDSFEFDLDTAAIAPIKHLMVTRGGILAMTQDNIWMLNGGGNGQALTPTNALADPQTYTGVSNLRPIPIDADILYTEGKGYAVRMLSYNEIARVYASEDKSILSNHLLGWNKEIVRWGYQESPFKTVWSVRSDGALLSFTIVKAEDVFAWTPCGTKGRFLDLVVVREVIEDRVYTTTQRYINGRWTKFIERMDLRHFYNVEDAWCVDAGLSLGGVYPAAGITIHKDGDDWIATADVAVFGADEGKILRAGNGIFLVDTVNSDTEAVLTVYESPTNFIPEDGDTRTFPIPEGDWTLDEPTAELGGLWHLEGESVAILGDGSVMPRQTVVGGRITLPVAVTRAIVGIPYECRAKTLPLIVPDAGIESRRKRVPSIAVRLTRSRGLRYGDSYDHLYEMKDRSTEAMGRPTRLQEGIKHQHIGTNWDENSHTYFKLVDPLPGTLLSIISDIEVGDEPD